MLQTEEQKVQVLPIGCIYTVYEEDTGKKTKRLLHLHDWMFLDDVTEKTAVH